MNLCLCSRHRGEHAITGTRRSPCGHRACGYQEFRAAPARDVKNASAGEMRAA